MNRIFLLLAGIFIACGLTAQTDSTRTDTTGNAADTLVIGEIIIIKKPGNNPQDRNDDYRTYGRRHYTPSDVSTNWWIVDLGINQISDNTNYAQAISNGTLPPGANEDWFNQRTIKSTNVNIWVFMQRVNLIKHVLNFKYGLGVELNNYRYTENIRFQPDEKPLVVMDAVDYRKNKLAADYATVPVMLNFNFTPKRRFSIGFSGGVSFGYLYSSRQKTIGGDKGKHKERDDFDLRKTKLAYIGEISMGPVRLYGSYATRSMFKNSLDQTPYSFGVRLSNW
jgi:hypothetical protein